MNHFKLFFATLLSSVLLISCNKDTFKDFNDSWSYKTSGTVTLQETRFVEATPEEKEQFEKDGLTFEPVTLTLAPEDGQLHFIDRGDGQVYLSFNPMLGHVTVAEASMDGLVFSIAENQEMMVRFGEGPVRLETATLILGGDGQVYDNAVVMNLSLSGKMDYKLKEMSVIGSKIKCVAFKNEK